MSISTEQPRASAGAAAPIHRADDPERFRRVLYEALVYGLGHTLSLYDTQSARMLTREMGRHIREYFADHGYRLKLGKTSDEAFQEIVELFVSQGFSEIDLVSIDNGVVHARWSHTLGFSAYERIRASGGDTFISCPLNSMLNDALDRFGSEIVSLNETFDAQREVIEAWEEIRPREVRPEVEALSLSPEKALEAVRESNRQLRMREEFIRVASHELATPIMSAELALGRLDDVPLDDQERRIVQVAQRQVQRLKRLAKQMLDTTMVQRGRIPLAKSDVDLAALVREVVSLLEAERARSGSSIAVDAPSPLLAHVDPERIEQVVTNLLSNAIKYGAGGPIDVRVDTEDGNAVLAVIDHGIGIDPASKRTIFEPFARAASTDYGGLGLGLYIARQLVEFHGGTITAESALGAGTTFTITVPLRAPS